MYFVTFDFLKMIIKITDKWKFKNASSDFKGAPEALKKRG